MNLDPDLLRLVASHGTDSPTPPDRVAARRAAELLVPLVTGPAGGMPVQSVEERMIDGPGGALPLRIYRPPGESAMAVIHLHGGRLAALRIRRAVLPGRPGARHTALPSAEVAFLLGYDEPNSCYRAFRHWAGTTPERLRASA